MTIKRVGLKLSSMTGTARPISFKAVLPKDKQAKEVFIVEQFARIQMVAGATLIDIRSNPDDSEGKADVLAIAERNEIGIQLTELKIAHGVASADRARKITKKLLDKILELVKPSSRIFVNVCSPLDYKNESLKLIGKPLDSLAEVIAGGIKNSVFSPSTADYFDKSKSGLKPNPLSIPEKLKETVTRVELCKVPEGHNIICHGRENVFVNFNFDIVVSSNELDKTLVSRIIAKKANSKADTLLVWSSDRDFWGQEEHIHRLFCKQVAATSFDNVYIFFFIDAEKIFEANKKVFIVKEKL